MAAHYSLFNSLRVVTRIHGLNRHSLQSTQWMVLQRPRYFRVTLSLQRAEMSTVQQRRPPHEVLGVPVTASVAEIKQAYYRMAVRYHPDTSKQSSEENARLFAEVTQAYKALLAAQQPKSTASLYNGNVSQDIRTQIDEKIIGGAAVEASRQFFAKGFFKIVGENFDVVIHRHLEKYDLSSAFETFHLMLAMGKRPTVATFEMLIRGCTMAMQQTADYKNADDMTKSLWMTVEDLLESMSKYDLKPDMWTYNEMIRAAGKAGRFLDAQEHFDFICENAFTLPTRPVCNTMLEACLRTQHPEKCFEVMEEMDEIKRSMWFKWKYRPDAATFGLLLKATKESGMFEKLPRVLELMSDDGLLTTADTANRLIEDCLNAKHIDIAHELTGYMRRYRLPVTPDVQQKLIESSKLVESSSSSSSSSSSQQEQSTPTS